MSDKKKSAKKRDPILDSSYWEDGTQKDYQKDFGINKEIEDKLSRGDIDGSVFQGKDERGRFTKGRKAPNQTRTPTGQLTSIKPKFSIVELGQEYKMTQVDACHTICKMFHLLKMPHDELREHAKKKDTMSVELMVIRAIIGGEFTVVRWIFEMLLGKADQFIRVEDNKGSEIMLKYSVPPARDFVKEIEKLERIKRNYRAEGTAKKEKDQAPAITDQKKANTRQQFKQGIS